MWVKSVCKCGWLCWPVPSYRRSAVHSCVLLVWGGGGAGGGRIEKKTMDRCFSVVSCKYIVPSALLRSLCWVCVCNISKFISLCSEAAHNSRVCPIKHLIFVLKQQTIHVFVL